MVKTLILTEIYEKNQYKKTLIMKFLKNITTLIVILLEN